MCLHCNSIKRAALRAFLGHVHYQRRVTGREYVHHGDDRSRDVDSEADGHRGRGRLASFRVVLFRVV